jgi:hypothetical protein
MTKWMNTNQALASLLVALTLLLGGCGNLGGFSVSETHRITIESDPGGATVVADGIDIGVTPLTFVPSDAFRSGFTSTGSDIISYRFLGKLHLKKPGCKDYVTEVDDNLLAKDIHVKMECDPNYRPPAPQPATSPIPAPATSTQPATSSIPTPAAPTQPAIPASAEQRLLRIESLHEKGLVSDEEYQRLRKRVLDTL